MIMKQVKNDKIVKNDTRNGMCILKHNMYKMIN